MGPQVRGGMTEGKGHPGDTQAGPWPLLCWLHLGSELGLLGLIFLDLLGEMRPPSAAAGAP